MKQEVTFIPFEKKIQVKRGTSLLDAGRRAGVPIRTRCGGKAGCLMCKVKVTNQSGITAPSVNERNKLGSLIDQQIRLACQARVTGNVTVEVPEDPLKAAIRKQLQKEDDFL